jgi:hypothetical protein
VHLSQFLSGRSSETEIMAHWWKQISRTNVLLAKPEVSAQLVSKLAITHYPELVPSTPSCSQPISLRSNLLINWLSGSKSWRYKATNTKVCGMISTFQVTSYSQNLAPWDPNLALTPISFQVWFSYQNSVCTFLSILPMYLAHHKLTHFTVATYYSLCTNH